MNISDQRELLIDKLQSITHCISSVDEQTEVTQYPSKGIQRTKAGSELPDYYFCYFLLVDILGFRDSGQAEKVDWSIPIKYNSKIFWIEHRKLGLGLFASAEDSDSEDARKLVAVIRNAVHVAMPIFEKMANAAASTSNLNVTNNHDILFSRYQYFLDLYRKKKQQAQEMNGVTIRTQQSEFGYTISFPETTFNKNSKWLALACIDAFFSWTEHIFILIAILNGKATTGTDIAKLAELEWADKFRSAIDLNTKEMKGLYDNLSSIKKQLRNFLAHGAFGKHGEAFSFHSSAGAVPIILPKDLRNSSFSFSKTLGFQEESAISVIEDFISKLWESPNGSIVKIYLESGLPLILSYTQNGWYKTGMESIDSMISLIDEISSRFDRAANMDW